MSSYAEIMEKFSEKNGYGYMKIPYVSEYRIKWVSEDIWYGVKIIKMQNGDFKLKAALGHIETQMLEIKILDPYSEPLEIHEIFKPLEIAKKQAEAMSQK